MEQKNEWDMYSVRVKSIVKKGLIADLVEVEIVWIPIIGDEIQDGPKRTEVKIYKVQVDFDDVTERVEQFAVQGAAYTFEVERSAYEEIPDDLYMGEVSAVMMAFQWGELSEEDIKQGRHRYRAGFDGSAWLEFDEDRSIASIMYDEEEMDSGKDFGPEGDEWGHAVDPDC